MASKWQSATIGASFALFVVWMERKGRWTLFFKAIGGSYIVSGARGNATSTGVRAGQNPGPVTAGPQGHNDIRPTTTAPSSTGQIGVNPHTGQGIFQS